MYYQYVLCICNCTMRGLEHAEGLDGARAFSAVSASLTNSPRCLTQKVRGTQDKSPSSTFHTVGRV